MPASVAPQSRSKGRSEFHFLFLPYPATPTKWTYKAIYRVGDHQVDQWSGEVSVIVGG